MTDCLIVGYNAANYQDYIDMIKSMGVETGNYRDVRLHHIEHEGKAFRSMDVINYFRAKNNVGSKKPLHNFDFLMPTILYLGSYLSKRGFTFDFVNMFHYEKDLLKEKLIHGKIRTIAIATTMYVTPQPIIEIISFIRNYNKEAKIIVGGPYVLNVMNGTASQKEAERVLKFIGADFYVINSEGEAALAQLIPEIKKGGKNYKAIDNIAYKEDDKLIFTNAGEENNILENNRIDYSLFNKKDLGRFISLRTSKSCPFACTYCGFHERGGKYRFLSGRCIEEELDAIYNSGDVEMLTFVDDTFNVPKDRFKEILGIMIRKQYNFKWNCFYRSDFSDDETIKLMKEAGCEGVFLGAESGNETVLKNMNKSARPKDILRAVPKFREAGILTHMNFIIGFPGETEASVQDTIHLIREARPDFYTAQLWYCDPITQIYRSADQYGIKGSAFGWTHNTMDYKQACHLLEKVFLSIDSSIWSPLDGFAFWSVMYLQKKGMSIEQVKEFLKCFQEVIKLQMLDTNLHSIPDDLALRLKEICNF